MKKIQFYRLVFLALLLAGVQVSAQDNNAAPADSLEIPADEFNRGTPLRSVEGFLVAVDTADYETAAEYLDTRNLRGEARKLTGAQLTRRLFVIINRATWADVNELIDDPAGRSNDNLPDYRDSIGVVLDGDKDVRLLMQKVPRGDGVFIWKVSNATVSLIPRLYATYGYPEWVEFVRRSLPNVSFMGYELFKWVIVLGIGMLIYVVVFLIALTIRAVLGEPDKPSRRRIFKFLVLPFGIWLALIAMNTVATSLGRGVTADTVQQYSPVPILVTVWMMFAGMTLIRDIYSNRLERRDRPHLLLDLYLQALSGTHQQLLFAGNLAFRELELVYGLHVLEVPDVEARHERDRHPGLAGAAGAPGAVEIDLGRVGGRIADHMGEIADVDSARRDVRSDQQTKLPRLDSSHRLLAGGLREVSRDLVRIEAALLQVRGDEAHVRARVAEDDRALGIFVVQQLREQRFLLGSLTDVVEVLDLLRRHLIGVDRDVGLFREEEARERPHLLGDRGREQM